MSRRKNYGQKAAVALKYNPSLNYAPVVVASGLGELAQRIVNDYHKGKIIVKSSEPGKGTTFKITLPKK